jgi:outer membrane cobalamin receptor
MLQKVLNSLIVVLFFFYCPVILAQSTIKVEGYVRSENGQPIKDAIVSIGQTGTKVYSDKQGTFTISNIFNGTFQLSVSHVGYKEYQRSITIHGENVQHIIILLKPKVYQLDTVIVSSEKQVNRTNEIILNREFLEKTTASSIDEVLLNLPGVDVQNSGNEQKVSIRGSQANQVLVLLDGIALNNPLTGDVDLKQIPLNVVEQISIKKDAAGQGSGAIGGTIEIKSKTSYKKQLQVQYTKAAFGNQSGGISASGKILNFNYTVGAHIRDEKNTFDYSYKTITGDIKEENQLNATFQAYGFNSSLLYTFPSSIIKTNIFFTKNERGLPGKINYRTPFAQAETERLILGADYLATWKKLTAEINYSFHKNKTHFINDPPDSAPLKFKTVPKYETHYSIKTNQATLTFDYNLFDGFILSNAYQIKEDDFKDSDEFNPFASALSKTINKNVNGRLELDGTIKTNQFFNQYFVNAIYRYDDFKIQNRSDDQNFHQWSRQLGLNISSVHTLVLSFGAHWAEGFRIPTFADLFYQGFRVKGNSSLKPEQGKNWDFSVQVAYPFYGQLNFNWHYFHKKTINEIVWMLGSFSVWQPFNTDTKTNGQEFALSWKGLDEKITIETNHTILKALNKNNEHTTHNKYVPFRPLQTSNFLIMLEIWDGIYINYSKRLVGKRFVTPANTVEMPGYTVDESTIIYNLGLQHIKMTMKATLTNIFNKSYQVIENAPNAGRGWRLALDVTY